MNIFPDFFISIPIDKRRKHTHRYVVGQYTYNNEKKYHNMAYSNDKYDVACLIEGKENSRYDKTVQDGEESSILSARVFDMSPTQLRRYIDHNINLFRIQREEEANNINNDRITVDNIPIDRVQQPLARIDRDLTFSGINSDSDEGSFIDNLNNTQ
ncbi:hypothetical protein A3Q56_03995 [Intoshia linei]|uniref:Uncharacterized protein n=1 Tax=Intoshia linei TaxID=1819745 RepID=A0A177B1X2_9BILA|nr:hypothetical protein A3Q56_03995 [Intoshia linei]